MNPQDIFKTRRFSLQSGIYPCQNAASLPTKRHLSLPKCGVSLYKAASIPTKMRRLSLQSGIYPYQNAASLPTKRHLSLPKCCLSIGMFDRDAVKTIFSRRPVPRRLLFLHIYFIGLGKVENLKQHLWIFTPFTVFALSYCESWKSVASLTHLLYLISFLFYAYNKFYQQ